ncbi:MAG: alpha/beta fold hydrolase [Bradyrhizobiaceae bacterium]|nr:alpha/beta fold hydrolase [Bradyrhizobiaceae bacterium]
MRITANGISINYECDGPATAPWVVFSNSLATNISMWEPQVAAFKDRFRMLRYDQRGHGGTDAPAGRYTFDLLMADAVALMDALAIERPHWIGLSMGGATGLGIAERYPDRLDRVVVCDTACVSTPASAQQWEERIKTVAAQGIEAIVEPTVRRWHPAEAVATNAPHIDNVRAMIRTTPANGFIGCAAALAEHDFRSAIATVTRPILFLVGEKDGVNPAAMQELHAALPGSQYVELADAGHIANLDQPVAFNRAINDFLA